MWKFFLAGCLAWMVAIVRCELSSPVSTSSYSAVDMTLTVDVTSSSVYNGSAVQEIQPTHTATTSCSDVNWEAEPLTCTEVTCVEKQLENLTKKRKCMEVKHRNVTFASMDIPEEAMDIGLFFAEEIFKLNNGDDVNSTAVITTSKIAMEVGVITSEHLNTTEAEFLTFPNYSDQAFSERWRSMRDSVALPIKGLPNSGSTVFYAVAILTDLFGNKYLAKDEMAWNDKTVALSHISELFVVGDQLFSRKKAPKKRINSNIISVSFEHENKTLHGPLDQPVKITFHHVHQEGLIESRCVHWDKRAWSTEGCRVKETSQTHTVCECSHFASFALVMTQEIKVDDSSRRMVVTIASVLGSFSMLGLLICIIVAIVVNYHNLDNMRIALNIDVSLLFSQLLFFVGLSTSDNLFYAKPEVCEVISPFIHLFELAALMWLLMEGFYYYSTLKPFFNEKNTIPMVFFFAMGWGIPIAFTIACAGYSYPHFGDPERSEFCWLFIQGKEAWFFGAPVLILVMLNIGIRVCIVKEVVCWQDDPDDVNIERAKTRLITSSFLMLVILMTWLFGILSVNHTEYKMLHYLFIILYTFQGLLVFFFYCVRNHEMWDYYKGKKEEEVREKNATYDFVYVP